MDNIGYQKVDSTNILISIYQMKLYIVSIVKFKNVIVQFHSE